MSPFNQGETGAEVSKNVRMGCLGVIWWESPCWNYSK